MSRMFFEPLLQEISDFSQIYDDFYIIFDFFIVFMIFLGIARATIGRRFEGSASKLISTGTALALACGFALMEKEMNFSLKSFGPLAVFAVVLIVAYSFYSLLRGFEVGRTTAFCVSYSAMYFSIALISPNVFDWIADQIPAVNGILLLVLFGSFIKLMVSVFSGRMSRDGVVRAEKGFWEQKHENDLYDQESEFRFAKKLRGLTRRELGSSNDIMGSLQNIYKAIQKYGSNAEARKVISAELEKIASTEHYANSKLNDLRRSLQRLGSHDASKLNELRSRLSAAQDKERSLIEKEIRDEEQKFKVEQELDYVAQQITRLTNEFNNHLSGAVETLKNSPYPAEALKHIDLAMRAEQAIRKIFGEMRTTEKNLLSIMKDERKVIKKAM